MTVSDSSPRGPLLAAILGPTLPGLAASASKMNGWVEAARYAQLRCKTPNRPAARTSPAREPAFAEAAESGSCFWTRLVSVGDASVQLAVPHEYPSGQHPATGPPSSPHMNHPFAHVAESDAGTSATGTAMVTPLLIIVVIGVGGHDVSLQSRPVWQQPPPARARQA